MGESQSICPSSGEVYTGTPFSNFCFSAERQCSIYIIAVVGPRADIPLILHRYIIHQELMSRPKGGTIACNCI